MKVYLDTVGCRLNQAEIEGMASEFRAGGHEVVASPRGANLAVINTCTVTTQAAADSRALIRRVHARGAHGIVATGCWATLRPADAASMGRIVEIVRNPAKKDLVRTVLGRTSSGIRTDHAVRAPIPGTRHRTRAFIKAQDGCDNRCTFCVTTLARGPAVSRPSSQVIAEVRAAVAGGAREVVLTGVHLGSWGADLGLGLKDLIGSILRETSVPRVRLSSLEAWDLEPDFFELWDDPRLCRHFHLPLQSGCASTLRRMARRTTPQAFRDLVRAVRHHVPDAAITTDVIAGFPGETEREFQRSLEFVREMEFAGGHAFTFSAMPGTAAARMRGQVEHAVRRARTRKYLDVFHAASTAFREKHTGHALDALWERADPNRDGSWTMQGLTDNYIRVRMRDQSSRWNRIDPVRLLGRGEATIRETTAETG